MRMLSLCQTSFINHRPGTSISDTCVVGTCSGVEFPGCTHGRENDLLFIAVGIKGSQLHNNIMTIAMRGSKHSTTVILAADLGIALNLLPGSTAKRERRGGFGR